MPTSTTRTRQPPLTFHRGKSSKLQYGGYPKKEHVIILNAITIRAGTADRFAGVGHEQAGLSNGAVARNEELHVASSRHACHMILIIYDLV